MNEQELYVLLEGGEELPIKDLKDPVLFRLDTHTELCTVGVDWDKVTERDIAEPGLPTFDPDLAHTVCVELERFQGELPEEVFDRCSSGSLCVADVPYLEKDPRYTPAAAKELQTLEALAKAERACYWEIHKRVYKSSSKFQQVPEEAYKSGPSFYARILCPESKELYDQFLSALQKALDNDQDYRNNPFNELRWLERGRSPKHERLYELQTIHPYRVNKVFWFGTYEDGNYSWFYKMGSKDFLNFQQLLDEEGQRVVRKLSFCEMRMALDMLCRPFQFYKRDKDLV